MLDFLSLSIVEIFGVHVHVEVLSYHRLRLQFSGVLSLPGHHYFLFPFDDRLMMKNEGIVGKEERNAFIVARAAW